MHRRFITPRISRNTSPEEWRDIAEVYKTGINSHTDDLVADLLVTHMDEVPKHHIGKVKSKTPYHELMVGNQQLDSGSLNNAHNATLLLSPESKHVAVLRRDYPSEAVKLWDPNGLNPLNNKSAFNSVLPELMQNGLSLTNLQNELHKFQSDRGTCSIHSLDRFCHTYDPDDEYYRKTYEALYGTTLPRSGIPENEWLDLARISQAMDIAGDSGRMFDIETQLTEAQIAEHNASYLGEGKKDRRGFR